MKIISKHKDFYDYLQGNYGIDNTVVYNRNWKDTVMYKPYYLMPFELYQPKPVQYTIAICGVVYIVYIWDKKFYFGEDIKLLLNSKKTKYDRDNKDWYFNTLPFETRSLPYHLCKTKINEIEKEPILLLKNEFYSSWSIMNKKDPEHVKWEVIARNIRLIDFGIPQVLSAHDIYIQISNFLSKEKVIVDKRTDKEKIISHGMDTKTSFRKTKISSENVGRKMPKNKT